MSHRPLNHRIAPGDRTPSDTHSELGGCVEVDVVVARGRREYPPSPRAPKIAASTRTPLVTTSA